MHALTKVLSLVALGWLTTRRTVPRIITPDHPEADNILVLDEYGRHMKGVLKIDTTAYQVHQIMYRDDGTVCTSRGAVMARWVPYTELQLKDGRDPAVVLRTW